MLVTPKQIKQQHIITPYTGKISHLDGEKIMSFGASGAGYDIRVSDKFLVPNPEACLSELVIDPKNTDDLVTDGVLNSVQANEPFPIPPGTFILAVSEEYFQVPTNMLGIVTGKSSYARNGIIVNVTPLEPGWQGYLTIEISNTAPFSVLIYPKEGIAQVVFFQSDEIESQYIGKYQSQLNKPITSS